MLLVFALLLLVQGLHMASTASIQAVAGKACVSKRVWLVSLLMIPAEI
jgi:hypothetical protein